MTPGVARLICLAPSPAVDRLIEVDRLTYGQIHRPKRVVVVAGGKGLNVARAAVQLGAPVVVVAFLGGHIGRWIEEELERSEVPVRFVTVPGETRVCFSILDREQGHLTEVYEMPPAITAAHWAAISQLAFEQIANAGDLFAISGGFPEGVPNGGLADLCFRAQAAGAKVAVDTHGSALHEVLPTAPWLVKINAAEAAAVSEANGTERSALSLATELVARGAANAIVTQGAAGAAMAGKNGAWHITPPPGQGLYPVGSGDSFLAGLCAAVLEGRQLPEAARRGAAAASANALQPGAGAIDRAAVEHLTAAVSLIPAMGD